MWKHGGWASVHTCADLLTHGCQVSIASLSLLLVFFSETECLTKLEPHTQDPALLPQHWGSGDHQTISVFCVGATDPNLGPRACVVSTLYSEPSPGFRSYRIVTFLPITFGDPWTFRVVLIYLTTTNLFPIIWYLLIIQSDVGEFTARVSHLQSWICVWIVIGKIADVIFMREAHGECDGIVGLALLSPCSNWASREVISAIQNTKHLIFHAEMFSFSSDNFIN